MSSEEEIIKMQKVLAASVILIALSIGIGGFESFETWYQIDIEDEATYDDGYSDDGNYILKFNLEGFEVEADVTSYDNSGSETYTDRDSVDLDYGENDIYEESENSMKNIQRVGYLVLALILFMIWKFQELKSEVSEEIRSEIFEQVDKCMKGAGTLVVIGLLYFVFGGFAEEDYDDFYVGKSDSDGYYYNFFGVECEEGWDNKPEFSWTGNSNFKYDDSICPDVYYSMAGDGQIKSSLKLGFLPCRFLDSTLFCV